MIFWPTQYSNEFLWILTPLLWVSESFRQDIGLFLGWSPANWRIISSLISIFIMTNLTDLRKTVETGVDPRLLLQRHRISQGQFPTVDAACFDQRFCSWFCNTRSDKAGKIDDMYNSATKHFFAIIHSRLIICWKYLSRYQSIWIN